MRLYLLMITTILFSVGATAQTDPIDFSKVGYLRISGINLPVHALEPWASRGPTSPVIMAQATLGEIFGETLKVFVALETGRPAAMLTPGHEAAAWDALDGAWDDPTKSALKRGLRLNLDGNGFDYTLTEISGRMVLLKDGKLVENATVEILAEVGQYPNSKFKVLASTDRRFERNRVAASLTSQNRAESPSAITDERSYRADSVAFPPSAKRTEVTSRAGVSFQLSNSLRCEALFGIR